MWCTKKKFPAGIGEGAPDSRYMNMDQVLVGQPRPGFTRPKVLVDDSAKHVHDFMDTRQAESILVVARGKNVHAPQGAVTVADPGKLASSKPWCVLDAPRFDDIPLDIHLQPLSRLRNVRTGTANTSVYTRKTIPLMDAGCNLRGVPTNVTVRTVTAPVRATRCFKRVAGPHVSGRTAAASVAAKKVSAATRAVSALQAALSSPCRAAAAIGSTVKSAHPPAHTAATLALAPVLHSGAKSAVRRARARVTAPSATVAVHNDTPTPACRVAARRVTASMAAAARTRNSANTAGGTTHVASTVCTRPPAKARAPARHHLKLGKPVRVVVGVAKRRMGTCKAGMASRLQKAMATKHTLRAVNKGKHVNAQSGLTSQLKPLHLRPRNVHAQAPACKAKSVTSKTVSKSCVLRRHASPSLTSIRRAALTCAQARPVSCVNATANTRENKAKSGARRTTSHSAKSTVSRQTCNSMPLAASTSTVKKTEVSAFATDSCPTGPVHQSHPHAFSHAPSTQAHHVHAAVSNSMQIANVEHKTLAPKKALAPLESPQGMRKWSQFALNRQSPKTRTSVLLDACTRGSMFALRTAPSAALPANDAGLKLREKKHLSVGQSAAGKAVAHRERVISGARLKYTNKAGLHCR